MTRAPNMPPPIEEAWPAIVLVTPQMGENIGAVARGMLNFGLVSLRLVSPRDRWPNPKAEQVAVGADAVLNGARIEWRTEDALADSTFVIAATAAARHGKAGLGRREAALNSAPRWRRGAACGDVRPEASGLETEDVARADAILTLPVNRLSPRSTRQRGGGVRPRLRRGAPG